MNPTFRWDYHHADGTLAGYVLRFDTDGKKTILPHFTPEHAGGFKAGIPQGFLRPLYGLVEALKEKTAPVLSLRAKSVLRRSKDLVWWPCAAWAVAMPRT